jgi:hypothetical protein
VRTLITKCVLETNKKETIEEKDAEHEKEDIIEEESNHDCEGVTTATIRRINAKLGSMCIHTTTTFHISRFILIFPLICSGLVHV